MKREKRIRFLWLFENIPILTQIILLFVTGLTFSSCTSERAAVSEDYHFIRFHTIGRKIPLIKGALNDKAAWFIVDTGSTVTMLNTCEANYFGFSLKDNPAVNRTEITGFANKLTVSETSWCKIQIGHLVIRHRAWKSQDMEALFLNIKENERMRIAGIVGSDILAKYGINVNYDSKTLSYLMKGSLRN